MGILLQKYDPEGHFLRQRDYNRPDYWEESVEAVVLPDGSIMVAGIERNNDRSEARFLITKWTTDLVPLWQTSIDTGSGVPEILRRLVIDSTGAAFMAGERGSQERGFSPMIAKILPSGGTEWVALMDVVNSGPRLGPELRVAREGDVVISTEYKGDVLTVRYQQKETPFLRGDSNEDGKVDLADAVTTLVYLFSSGAAPSCADTADADDSGKIEITDPIFLLGALFLGTNAVPEPYPICGLDSTVDELGCGTECTRS